DLDKPVPDGNPKPPFLGNTKDVSGGDKNPNVIVRVGRARHQEKKKKLGYSPHGGKTWHEPAAMPSEKASESDGAGSADGKIWVWTPREEVPYVTSDKGATWTACAGLPTGTRVAADRVNGKRFYAMALFDGKLFESTDGAVHFSERPLVLPEGLPK